MSVLIKVLHAVQSTYINVEANDEDKIDVELCEEEIFSVTVPLKVNYYLNCFLLEKIQILTLHQCFYYGNLIFSLNFAHAKVIELHFMLIWLIIMMSALMCLILLMENVE